MKYGLAFAFAVVGCSSGAAVDMTDLAVAPPDLAPPADLRAPGYPAGPYGANNGDTIPNFTFQGWWSPTATTGLATDAPNVLAEVDLDMLRKQSGAKFGLLFFGAFY